MTASDIQDELSCAEDSEVFLSADSTAQGTMYSPTFRHSLARPSVREITERVSGTKRSQPSDSDSDEADSKESNNYVQQTRKSARLEGAHPQIPSKQSLGVIEHISDKGSSLQKGCPKDTLFEATSDTGHLPGGSLTRPPIRSSGRVIIDALTNDSTETSELFSAQSISYEVSIQSQDIVHSNLTEEGNIEMSSYIPEKTQAIEEEESVPGETNCETNNSVEIVSIDDGSGDAMQDTNETPVIKDSEFCQSSQEDENSDHGDLIINDNSNLYYIGNYSTICFVL